MGKIFLFIVPIAIGISLLSIASCGGAKTDDNANAGVPQGMTTADLSVVSEGRMQILINVPDSTFGSLEIIANAQGGADVKVGENFQMTITEGAGDVAMKKNDITHDEVRKFVKYVVEDSNYLIWEWQIDGMEPEFHFYAIVKAGVKTFEVRDVEGEVFSEKAATEMLDAAKSIRMKAPKAES